MRAIESILLVDGLCCDFDLELSTTTIIITFIIIIIYCGILALVNSYIYLFSLLLLLLGQRILITISR